MTNWRKIEKKVNERWVLIHRENIRKGDKIRMFENDGTPVKDNDGNTEFNVKTDAKPCEPIGNFYVDVETNRK